MEFKDFCILVKGWNKKGVKLKIKDLATMKTKDVIAYEVIDPTFKSGAILSFEVEPSHALMICENVKSDINKIDKSIYEIEVAKEHYQIIIKEM